MHDKKCSSYKPNVVEIMGTCMQWKDITMKNDFIKECCKKKKKKTEKFFVIYGLMNVPEGMHLGIIIIIIMMIHYRYVVDHSISRCAGRYNIGRV